VRCESARVVWERRESKGSLRSKTIANVSLLATIEERIARLTGAVLLELRNALGSEVAAWKRSLALFQLKMAVLRFIRCVE
jgi:hypothetical protein